MRLWRVWVSVVQVRDGWTCSLGTPTFYVDSGAFHAPEACRCDNERSHVEYVVRMIVNPHNVHEIYIHCVPPEDYS